MRNFFIVLLMLVMMASFGFAQQTVLTVPSVDVLDKGKAYVRADLGYGSTTASFSAAPNVMYGMGHNIETSFNIESFSKGNRGTVSLVPGVKWRFLTPDGEGLFAYVGDKVYLPVYNKTFSGGNYLYAVAGLAVDGGLRIGGGAYNAQNVAGRGNHSGALFTVEKVLKTRLKDNSALYTLLYDWQSGNGPNGSNNFGLAIFPNKRLMVIPSYQVGNSNLHAGNHGATLYVGYALN